MTTTEAAAIICGQRVRETYSGAELSCRYGISACNASRIVRNKTWRRAWPDHDALCFCVECMPSPRDEDETKGEAT